MFKRFLPCLPRKPLLVRKFTRSVYPVLHRDCEVLLMLNQHDRFCPFIIMCDALSGYNADSGGRCIKLNCMFWNGKRQRCGFLKVDKKSMMPQTQAASGPPGWVKKFL